MTTRRRWSAYQVMFDTTRYHRIGTGTCGRSDVSISERILQSLFFAALDPVGNRRRGTCQSRPLIRLSGNAASGLNHAVALSKEHAEREERVGAIAGARKQCSS